MDQGVTTRQKKTRNVCPGIHRRAEWASGSSAAARSKKTKAEMRCGQWIQCYWRQSLKILNSFSGSVRVKPWQEWVQDKREKRNWGQHSFQGGSLPREIWAFAFSSVWEGCLLLHFSVFFTVGVLGVFQSWRSCILLFFFHIVDTWWSESGKKRYMVDLRGFVIVGISSQTKAPRRILGATILL